MSAPCECLAAWVDTEPCICNEPIGAPMEVSEAKLAQANRLVRHLRSIEDALAYLGKLEAGKGCGAVISYGYDNRLELFLPADIAAGLIRTMRFHATVQLRETGVVSTQSGHRPVVSA